MKGQEANFARFKTHAQLPIFPEESWVREWIRIRVDVEIFESGKLFEFGNFWLEYWLILFGSGSFRTWALKVKFLPFQLIWIYFVTRRPLQSHWNLKCQNVNFMFTHECFQPDACRSAPGVFRRTSNDNNVYALSCVILKSFFFWTPFYWFQTLCHKTEEQSVRKENFI